jgi:hypothetical protein
MKRCSAIIPATMKFLPLLLTLIILATSAVSAQQNFFLKNKKSGRLKKIKQKTSFGFDVKPTDSLTRVSYFGRLIAMTDSTLTIEEYVKRSLRHAIKPEIWTIEIHNIKSIKNYLIDSDDFNTFGGMLIIGGILGVVATPIVWLSAMFTAGLFAAGGLFLLPQLIGKRRHMTKWEFLKGQ